MRDFLDALNRPADAFRRQNRLLAWGFVGATILAVTILDPLLGLWINGFQRAVFSADTLRLILFGIASYTAMGTGLYLVCRALGSTTPFRVFLNTWGLTYLPTLACAIVVGFVENLFFLFWGNALLGMAVNLLLGGVLIWKTILYIVFLRDVAGLRKTQFWTAFFVCGVLVLVLAFANMAVGLKTPVL